MSGLTSAATKKRMNIVLVEPEIPPNTGNVARLCAATRTTLHLIEPFGFKLDDARLKRAGMDYWQQVKWHRWLNWPAFEEKLPADARLWLVESNGAKNYSEVKFAADDYLVFGRETAGLPKQLLENHREHWLRIPMFNAESRSLNLSNCVALVLFEALRQQGFKGEIG
jgi:tRNA (cytidine/uridine-2'-O-)-methyltransferase